MGKALVLLLKKVELPFQRQCCVCLVTHNMLAEKINDFPEAPVIMLSYFFVIHCVFYDDPKHQKIIHVLNIDLQPCLNTKLSVTVSFLV